MIKDKSLWESRHLMFFFFPFLFFYSVTNIAQRVKRKGLPNLKNETKMKVCVIGNDIGGIVAAQQLEAFGHEVTVFLNSEHLSVSQCQQTQMGGKSWDLGSFLMPKDYCNEVREEASPVSYEILGSKSSNKVKSILSKVFFYFSPKSFSFG